MRALEILRMEDFRRSEANRLGIEFREHPELMGDNNNNDENNTEIVGEMATNYRRTIFQTTIWLALVLLAYLITLFCEFNNFRRL